MQTERSGKQYTHLSAEERAVLMVMLDEKHSLRGIAARLGRAPSTLSRELARTLDTGARGAACSRPAPYWAAHGTELSQHHAHAKGCFE